MSRAGRSTDGRPQSPPAQPTGESRPSADRPSRPKKEQPASERPVSGAAGADKVPPADRRSGDETEPPGSWGGWERLIRASGIIVSLVAAFLSGILELLLTTMRAGDLVTVWRGDAIGSGTGPLIGIAVLLAVAGNVAIAWFAVVTTGRRWALGPPWALWTLLMLFAAGSRTAEGDYLLGGTNYVALAMILIGSLTYAVYAYRLILKRIPPGPGN